MNKSTLKLDTYVVFLRNFIDSLASLLFPSHCLHCKDELPQAHNLLCPVCLAQVECIDPQNRCPLCFLEDCTCKKSGLPNYTQLGCCFEYEGPQRSLLIALKFKDKPFLAQSLASFMFLQHQTLGWKTPDIITYIPQSFLRTATRGYNQSALLAEHLGAIMQVPVLPLLKRTAFSISQTRLKKEDRKLLSPDIFACTYSAQKNDELENKHLLLIDDVLTTGTTVQHATTTLQLLNPSAIDVLCLMRAEI